MRRLFHLLFSSVFKHGCYLFRSKRSVSTFKDILLPPMLNKIRDNYLLIMQIKFPTDYCLFIPTPIRYFTVAMILSVIQLLLRRFLYLGLVHMNRNNFRLMTWLLIVENLWLLLLEVSRICKIDGFKNLSIVLLFSLRLNHILVYSLGFNLHRLYRLYWLHRLHILLLLWE